MRRAGIYARISLDRAGEAAGVERQIADCRTEAERRGWEVTDVYVDNDVSAYSGRRRPEYERMLDDLAAGVIEALVVYHLDRLTRRPVELEQFLELAGRAGIKELATVHGSMDLGTGDGLLVARIMAAVAANESASKSRRVARKARERAEQGKPHRTSLRPFGFEDDHVTVRESEAAVIRDMASRFLAGESIGSLVRWLTESDWQTPTGRDRWNRSTVRAILRSGRIAGLREYHGEVIGDAVWPAIITTEQHERLRRILDDPARRTNRGSRRYLLAGFLRCGKCGTPLYSRPRDGRHRYICRRDDKIDGCGGVFITGAPLDQLISEAVLMRLDTPELAAAIQGRQADTADAQALANEVTADDAQLQELADLYGNRHITAKEWTAARKPIEQRLTINKRRLANLTGTGPIAALAGQGGKLRDSWDTLNLDRQRAILGAVLDHAIVYPIRGTGQHHLDPRRVKPIWKL